MSITWDLLEDDFLTIAGWDNGDVDVAVSEAIIGNTPLGQLRLDTNAGAAGNAVAIVSQDIGSIPNEFTAEIRVHHDSLGVRLSTDDHFVFDVIQGDERVSIEMDEGGVYFYDSGTTTTTDLGDLVKHDGNVEWQIWRLLVTFGTVGEGVVDVYLHDSTHAWSKVGSAIPCSITGSFTDGTVRFRQYGHATDNRLTHVDYVRIATGLFSDRTWDLLDENFDSRDEWWGTDNDTAVSEISPAGQLRLDTNTGAAGDAYCSLIYDVGDMPATATAEIKVYHDNIGTIAAEDHFKFRLNRDDDRSGFSFGSDGLFAIDAGGDTEIGTNLVKEGGSAEWQTWRFLITFNTSGNATCDVYLNDSTHAWSKVGNGVDCSDETDSADGYIYLYQYGYTTNDMVSHVDYVKVRTGLYIPGSGAAMFVGCNF